MENKLYLTSPMPPSVNHYTSVRVIYKNGKPMPVVYETTEAKKYKKDFKSIIEKEVITQKWNMEVNKTQHFYVDCVFYFDRIDKDAPNYDKCLLDTITETQKIWCDDNVVCLRINRIFYDAKNPRIEMVIYPVDYIGIFDTEEIYRAFNDKCKTCKRYARNCSILKKAVEGRIQEEIHEMECSKYAPVPTEKKGN